MHELSRWFIEQQFRDGSFPAYLGSSFSHTRGTGKIFEALALLADKGPALRAGGWLAQMQYNEQNLFFVPPHFRQKLVGGLRHDYANPQAWIDSAAHFLIGTARILGGDK